MPPWASPLSHTIQYSVSDTALGDIGRENMIDVARSVYVHLKTLEYWLVVTKKEFGLICKICTLKKTQRNVSV